MKQLNCILLIDDDEVTNYLHQSILEELAVTKQIAICSDGKAGLEFLKQIKEDQSPELIFVDLNMPVLDGFGFLEAYKNQQYYQKFPSMIVVLSSSNNPRDKQQVEALGIAKFITKPLNPEHILPLVKTYFEDRNS